MTSPDEWMATPVDRPCRSNPDRWFSPVRKDRVVAIALCERCPLLIQCREYALKERPSHGVWGGLTERERRPSRIRTAQPRRSSAAPVDCSNPKAWAQHRRRGETCEPCQAVRTEQIEQERRARLDAEHAANGGSMIGYFAHKALGEDPCPACREVNRARCAANRAATQRQRRRPTRQSAAAA
jgi:hypothetical protein